MAQDLIQKIIAPTQGDFLLMEELHKQNFEHKGWLQNTFKDFYLSPKWRGIEFYGVYPSSPPGTHFVGFLVGRMTQDFSEVITLSVEPTWQNQGFGTKLLKAFMKDCVFPVHLEVAVNNTIAQKLYLKCGFEKTGLRKGYYRSPPHPPEDAYNMTCEESRINVKI